MKNILNNLVLELEESAKHPENITRFYKDGKTRLGLTSPAVKKISSKHFKEAKNSARKKFLF